MIREQEAFLRRLMIIADIGVVAASFILSYFLRENIHSFYKLDLIPSRQVIGMPAPLDMYLWLLLFILPIWSGLLYFQGIYKSFRTRKFIEIFWIILKTGFFGILLFGSAVFIFKLHYVSRFFILLFTFLSGCLLSIEKGILIGVFRFIRHRGYNYRNFL
ncbi:MAG: sugar transferase, partial [Candidatus Omnitrophota bacterium]